MAFAITQNCCNDASCLSVCPVNCIHPTPSEPDFGKTELLYIDPRSCIDCGACADACPVDAISRISRLTPDQEIYADINAEYYRDRPTDVAWDSPRFPLASINELPDFEVAIVGTGPAACYTAQALLRVSTCRVAFYDRLPLPGGLARFGVAPDHSGTRRISEHFRGLFVDPRVTLELDTEIGVDIEHEELSSKFDAVVYAVGAERDRPLGIPGIDLPGSISARTVVGWYTGHPDVPADAVDLTGVDRVTIIGNGNVALDAARILTADPEDLDTTDIAPHALDALRRNRVREVVIVARRGPEHAAFTRSECQALINRPGVAVAVTGDPAMVSTIGDLPRTASASALVGADVVDLGSEYAGRRIVFSFGLAPTAVIGRSAVEFIDIGLAPYSCRVPTQLVLLAIGYRGKPTAGVPFDPVSGTIVNTAGRVTEADGTPVAGCYVVGWAKRGATGGIGDNKVDAEQTVDALLADLAARPASRKSARQLLLSRVRRHF